LDALRNAQNRLSDEETPLTAGLPFNFRKRYNDFRVELALGLGMA